MAQFNIVLEILMDTMTQTQDSFFKKLVSLIKEKKYTELENYLALEKKDLNLKYGAQTVILGYAVMKSDLKASEILINAGADVNYYDNDKENEIQKYIVLSQIRLSDMGMLNFLFEKGLKANNLTGEECLYSALKNQQLEHAKILIQNHAPYDNINWQEISSNTKSLIQPLIDEIEMKKRINQEKEKMEQILINNKTESKNSQIKL